LNATRAANPDARSALAGAARSWTGSFPVAEQREAGCSGGGGLLLICRIGARRCGTTGRWWAAAAAAIVGGRAAAGEASCCGDAAVENCGVARFTLVLSVSLFFFFILLVLAEQRPVL